MTSLVLLTSPRAGALASRYGVRPLLLAGFALLAGGMLLLARVPIDGNYARDVLPALVLLAIGSGVAYAPSERRTASRSSSGSRYRIGHVRP